MEKKIKRDYLNFANESSLSNIIKDEELLFTDKINKINRFGFTQERNIIITDKAIYNLKKKGKVIIQIFNIYSIKKKNFFKYNIGYNNKSTY